MVEIPDGEVLEQSAIRPSISVDQIIAGIDDKYGLLGDRLFERECIEILGLIDETRVAQGDIPYDDNQRIIVVRELFRVMEKFRGKKRKDGSSYFFKHLLGAVKILVKDIGLTEPASIIAEANHDSLEDLIDEEAIKRAIEAALEAALAGSRANKAEKDLTDSEIETIQSVTRRKALAAQREALMADLVDTSSYAHLISLDKNAAEEIARFVREMCLAVTKEKLSTVEATRDATLRHLLAVAMRNVEPIFIKFSDRKHNLLTLYGHSLGKDGNPLEGDELEKAKEKQKKIIEETELIYLPLARRTRVRNMVRFFVEQCMNFENPRLANNFNVLSRQCLAKRRKFYDEILNRFAANCFVDEVRFVPRGLDFYTAKSDKPFKYLTLDDLKVGQRDPMLDIVITTRREGGTGADSEEAVLTDVQDYFAGPGTTVEIKRPEKSVKLAKFDNLTGIKVYVFNPRFGGHLSIRINDRCAEKRLDRGVLVNFQEKTSQDLKALIGPVLNSSVDPDMGQGEVSRGRRGLLAGGEVGVLDVSERLRVFPSGATLLDFANDIHGDVLWGAQRASVENAGNPERTEAMEVSLIDPLEQGKIYFVDSCISGERRNRSKVRMHPRLLYFCQAPARRRMRQLLKDPWVPSMMNFTLAQEHFIRELNRTRLKSITTAQNGAWVTAKISSLKTRRPDSCLPDEQILAVLRSQDKAIDAVGTGYLRDLSELFGVDEKLIRRLLASALSLSSTERNSGGELSRRDQMRKRAIINRAVAVGDQRANPLFVLANRFEQIAVEENFPLKRVKDRLWKVEIVVPDRAGELSDFGKEFSRQVGVNLYDFRSKKRLKSHKDVMIFRIDPDSQGIPIYDFLVKLLKLRIKYPTTRLIQNPFMDVVEKESAKKPRGSATG